MNQDFMVKRNNTYFIDMTNLLPLNLDNGRTLNYRSFGINNGKLIISSLMDGIKTRAKTFSVNKLIELDDLFFEGLGLWKGEGGKDKGIYFGNTSLDLVLHFLDFVEEKFGLDRTQFKVTVNIFDDSKNKQETKKKYSEKINIPVGNFTRICVDPRINKEYVQVYLNGVILCELLKVLHEKLENILLSNKKFCIPYLRGLFAAEGIVALKKWGTLSHVDFSSGDIVFVEFLRKCLFSLDIKSGEYLENARKIQIYNKKNFKKFRKFKIHTLHKRKFRIFENGFNSYKRDVKSRNTMINLILNELLEGPKTYDDLSDELNKGRSTIQSHYIPIMEKDELIKRTGKKGRAWLFAITNKGQEMLELKN